MMGYAVKSKVPSMNKHASALAPAASYSLFMEAHLEFACNLHFGNL